MARTEKRVRGEEGVPPPYNAPGNDVAAGAVPSPPGLLNGDTVGVNEDMDNGAAEVNNDNLNDEKQGASPENECEGNISHWSRDISQFVLEETGHFGTRHILLLLVSGLSLSASSAAPTFLPHKFTL